MTTQAVLSGFLAILIGLIVYLANKLGKKSAQLEAVKEEAKKEAEERARAQTIMENVTAMSNDDARRKLCELQANSNKK